MIIIGFNLTFLVMHWTGLLGMRRRITTYAADNGWEWPNLISSVGGFVMAIGFALFTHRRAAAMALRPAKHTQSVEGKYTGMGDADPASELQFRVAA